MYLIVKTNYEKHKIQLNRIKYIFVLKNYFDHLFFRTTDYNSGGKKNFSPLFFPVGFCLIIQQKATPYLRQKQLGKINRSLRSRFLPLIKSLGESKAS